MEKVHRVHIATIVRFEAYNIIGPTLEDEEHCATADMLLAAHVAAWKQENPGEDFGDHGPFAAAEIIGAPKVVVMCFMRLCAYLEKNCDQAASWELCPARAVLNEMRLKAIPLLDGYGNYRESITPEDVRVLGRTGEPTAGWYTGMDKIDDPRFVIDWAKVRQVVEQRAPPPMDYFFDEGMYARFLRKQREKKGEK